MFMTVICLAPDQATARRLVAAAHALDFPLRLVELLPGPPRTDADEDSASGSGEWREDPELGATLVALGMIARSAAVDTWRAADRDGERDAAASLTALLMAWRLPEGDARRYGRRVAEGAVFIAVHAERARMQAAHDVLASHGGEDIADTDLGHAERIRVREVAAARGVKAGSGDSR